MPARVGVFFLTGTDLTHGWETIFHNTKCVIVNFVRGHSGVISDRQNIWEKRYVVVFRWSVLNIYIINHIASMWFQPVTH